MFSCVCDFAVTGIAMLPRPGRSFRAWAVERTRGGAWGGITCESFAAAHLGLWWNTASPVCSLFKMVSRGDKDVNLESFH